MCPESGRRRRIRLTVHLAGFATDAVTCSLPLCVALVLHATAFVPAAILTSLMLMVTQFLVFMRTDMYCVLQDVTGCRDM
jgi:hypothetical protein